MDYDRIIVEQMAKAGCKLIPKNTVGSISPDIEWIKWLSYEPEFEKSRMKYFDSKKVSELTFEELEEARKYLRNKAFAGLFKMYGTDECSEEDYMKVYDFMCDESIEELMLSKLTSEELRYAKQEITRLSNVPKEQLQAKVKKEIVPEIYKQLPMVDAYILHVLSGINFARNMDDFDKRISVQIKQKEIMRQRSPHYTTNIYVK